MIVILLVSGNVSNPRAHDFIETQTEFGPTGMGAHSRS